MINTTFFEIVGILIIAIAIIGVIILTIDLYYSFVIRPQLKKIEKGKIRKEEEESIIRLQDVFTILEGKDPPKRGRCANCKRILEVGARFCPHCYAKLKWDFVRGDNS